MREKILAQLVIKFPGVSKQFLGLTADKIAKKVTEESGIDQAITDYDNAVSISELATDFQKHGDSRVGEAQKLWEKKNPPKAPKTDDPKEDDDTPPADKMPAWAKGLMESVTALTREKAQTTVKQKATELLKEVPAEFWNGRAIPDKEDDLQTFVESVTTDYGTFKQGLIDKGLMQQTPPGGGAGADGVVKTDAKATDAVIKDWADKSKPVEVKK